eukprot:TRINITY_DN3896_c0_g1_i5.p1 TRINITY_DN3896_c0_g1~~TRINITY_DN3896_c0_g1_i5.p1  ORF type:complete len:369 (+),score=38.72 TRINITY_DN3896_c0_g1_i5:893-1999(+)
MQLEQSEKRLSQQLMLSKQEIAQLCQERETFAKRIKLQERQLALIMNQAVIPYEDNNIQFDSGLQNFLQEIQYPSSTTYSQDLSINDMRQIAKQWQNFIEELQRYFDNGGEMFKSQFEQSIQQAIDFCFNYIFVYPEAARTFFAFDIREILNNNAQVDENSNSKSGDFCSAAENQNFTDKKQREECNKFEKEQSVDNSDHQQTNSVLDSNSSEQDDDCADTCHSRGRCEEGSSLEQNSIIKVLQLDREQILNLVQLRELFLERWKELQKEIEDLVNVPINQAIDMANIQGCREISQLGLNFQNNVSKANQVFAKEHQLQVELYARIFKNILNLQQVAKFAVWSYPFFPDVLALASEACKYNELTHISQ